MVPELPPAPAALVDDGRAFLTVSLWSAAARLRMAARGPPGSERGRATLDPDDAAFEDGFEDGASGPDSGPEVKGEGGRGEAWNSSLLDSRLGSALIGDDVGRAGHFDELRMTVHRKRKKNKDTDHFLLFNQATLQAAKSSTKT